MPPKKAAPSGTTNTTSTATTSTATPSKTKFSNPLTQNLLDAAREASKKDFYQADLLDLGIVSTVNDLLPLLQELLRTKYVTTHTITSTTSSSGTTVVYRLRTSSAASSLANISADAHTIYEHIEAAGRNGIWTKTITQRTNFHQSNVTKALKALEVAKLVKQMKNVKTPTRKLYILYHLEPLQEATGGSWFSDGELDTELVEGVCNVVVRYIEGRSWRLGPKQSHHYFEKDMAGMTWDDASWTPSYSITQTRRQLIPYPAEYTDYPTTSEVLNYIERNDIIQGKDVSEEDMQILLDVCEYDGRLERMGLKKEDQITSRNGTVVDEDEGSASGSDDEEDDKDREEGDDHDVRETTESRDPSASPPITNKKRKRSSVPAEAKIHAKKPRAADDATPKLGGEKRFVPSYRSTRKPLPMSDGKGEGDKGKAVGSVSAYAEVPCKVVVKK